MTKLQPPTANTGRFRFGRGTGSVDQWVWPTAHPGVPLSPRIPLGPDSAPAELAGGGSDDMQGARPVDGQAEIIVQVTRDLWVFGYGSLVAAGEIERTIGRPIDTAFEYRTATLAGYRRKWNAGMRNHHNDPTDKYYELPDGTRPHRTISTLGIEPDQDSNVNGVVFRVSRVELRALDQRERRYRRIECSRQIVAELPIARQVFTYTPLASAMSLTTASRADGSDTVSEKYKVLVERGFQSLGPDAYAEYLASTDVPTSPVMPLRINRPNQAARSADEATSET